MKTITSTMVAALLLVSNTAQADGWTWVPSAEADFVMESTVSATAGFVIIDSGFANAPIAGIEWSFNCLFLEPPTNRIRQQVSFTRYRKSGIGINFIEINPHYTIELNPDLELGFGPGVGLIRVNSARGNGDIFGMQVGGSLHYYGRDPLFFGAQAQYQLTGNSRIGNLATSGIDNFRMSFKAGYRF